MLRINKDIIIKETLTCNHIKFEPVVFGDDQVDLISGRKVAW